MDDYKMKFKQGLDAGAQDQNYLAISHFKEILKHQIPKDWEIMTCINIGHTYYAIAQKALSIKKQSSHLNEDEIKVLENAFEYLDKADALAERYPTSSDFSEFKQAIQHCSDSLGRIGAFLSSLGKVENVLVENGSGKINFRLKLKKHSA